MQGTITTAIPAGWYADPTGEPQLRWWDGESWSEHTFTPEASNEVKAHDDAVAAEAETQSESMTVTVDVPQADPDELEVPTRRGRRAAASPVDAQVDDDIAAEPLAFLPNFVETAPAAEAMAGSEADAPNDAEIATATESTTEAESESASAGFLTFITDATRAELPDSFDQRMQTTATGPMQRESIMYTGIEGTREEVKARATRFGRARAHTASVWVLAIMPLLQTALGYGVIAFLPQTDNFRIILGALIVPWVWMIALAVRDRKRLIQFGHDTTAHWAWAALSPLIYLIVRTVRVHRLARRGSGPLWVWLMSTAAQVAAGVLMAGAVAGILTGLFSVEVAKNVESSIARQGAMVAVECPTDAPLTLGSEFQCAATHDTGRSYAVNVRVADLLGGFTWQLTDDATAVASAQ